MPDNIVNEQKLTRVDHKMSDFFWFFDQINIRDADIYLEWSEWMHAHSIYFWQRVRKWPPLSGGSPKWLILGESHVSWQNSQKWGSAVGKARRIYEDGWRDGDTRLSGLNTWELAGPEPSLSKRRCWLTEWDHWRARVSWQTTCLGRYISPPIASQNASLSYLLSNTIQCTFRKWLLHIPDSEST
jgi:hypothetical protein